MDTETEIKAVTIIIAMVCITILGMTWILLGHNSVALTALVGAICGLAGWALPSPVFQKKD